MEATERRLETLSYRTHHLDVLFSAQIVWRIDDYKKRFDQAKTGRRVSPILALSHSTLSCPALR